MAIRLSESAATRITRYLKDRQGVVGLRLGVKKTGCSGFAYVVDYADKVGPNDLVMNDKGVSILVDRDSLPLLDGTEVDFVRQGLNQSFQFNNPNVREQCGCGESFNV